MAKSKPHAKPAKPLQRGSSFAQLKHRLDGLDRDLVRLVNQRAQLALDLARQSPPPSPTSSTAGDLAVLENVGQLSKGPLSPRCLRTIFNELLSGSRALVTELKVAYLGPAYSYSHLAAMHRFGQSVELVPVGSIQAVFEEVSRGLAHFGLVPLENSTDGRVADTLDMFTRSPVRICGEVQLPIHHNLLAKCPRAEIEEIYSRPQALSQCRNWLSKHMPSTRTIEVTSTSTAAKLAQDKPGAAAIASVQAGVHYGLNVLAENIEDNTANVTRFAAIGKHSADRTGKDKSALMFEIQHRPGALADAMAIFKRNRLNLTWIESFPIPNHPGGYLFFVELDGHEHDAKVRRATESLRRKAIRLEIVGSYPRSEPVI